MHLALESSKACECAQGLFERLLTSGISGRGIVVRSDTVAELAGVQQADLT
ncbi:hypothetical protein D3C80_2219030 [compost metagenome]